VKNNILFIILFTLNIAYPKEFCVLINNKQNYDSIVFTQPGDTISFILNSSGSRLSWAEFFPANESYDNTILKQRYLFTYIRYNIKLLARAGSEAGFRILSDTIKPGTYYFGICQDTSVQSFNSSYPIYNLPGVIQIVNRKNNNYFGYLEELNNTPFILAPGIIPFYGHQTDCRIGSDCAEFIIYGKRRQGFNIPYCGPKGLVKYLNPVCKDSIVEGCIIHFGEQTALLYKDNGIKNRLDEEDILLQCYKRGPEKIKVKDSEFRQRNYKVYVWKPEYN
jgi:hypothetical protein